MVILSTLISIYMLIIVIRIIVSWLGGAHLGRAGDVLAKITDPYLSYFRRFSKLKTERVDFSPLVALLVLVVLQNVTGTIAATGRITLGIFLSLIISAIWSAISFLLTFFLIIMIIRFFGLMLGGNSVHPIWRTLDVILRPILVKISNIFSGGKPLTYPAALGISGISFLVIILVGRFAVGLLTAALRSLPI
jgi:YggT family protein